MKLGDLQPLMEAMMEAVWLVDPIELRIVATNGAGERLIGAAPGSLKGKPVIDVAAAPEDIFFWEDVAAGLSDRIFSETLLRREDGETVQVDRRVTRVQFAGESPMYVIGMRDRSEQHHVEEELEKLIAELRATLDSTADGILVIDPKDAIRGYNYRFSELWNLPQDLLTKRDDGSIFAWMIQNVVDSAGYAERLGVIANAPLLEATDIVELRSGRVLERVTLPQYARGRPIGRVFSFRDITRRLADDVRLQLAAKVFEANPDATFVTDPRFAIVAANPSCERMSGYTQAELLKLRVWDFFSEGCDAACIELLTAKLARDTVWQGELWNRRKDGEIYPSFLSLTVVLDDRDRITHYIGMSADISRQKASEERIVRLAEYDALTALANRTLLRDRCEQAMAMADREGVQLSLLCIDLDRFKTINDSLGHAVGDRLLTGWPRAWWRRCAKWTRWAGWAATSSWCCSYTMPTPAAPSPSRGGSWNRWRNPSAPTGWTSPSPAASASRSIRATARRWTN